MDYLGDNAGLGLTTEQTDKVLQFQDLTGIEDISVCRDVLQRHQWNLEVAVQEQLNIREGRPSVYATEARPPAVISDHLTQHIFYTPPTDGSGSGLRGFIRSIFSLFWTVCYSTIFAIFRFGHRFLRGDNRGYITNPLEDVRSFIKAYEEKYSSVHPVFYQGTYSQVLNDAKRELKFLLVYLHKDDAVDTPLFCRDTLSHIDVVMYVNTHFFFWGCNVSSGEGSKVSQLYKPSHFPFVAVVVLRDGRMTIVSRMEGYCEAALFVQRLTNVVREFDVNLRQARQDRMAQNLNRSIRAHQDEAFLESLRADQEKDRQREEQKRLLEEAERQKESEALEEQRRKEQIARDKIDSREKVPIEPDESHPDAIHLVIKLPCGVRINRRFLKSHSMEAIFYFVYCHPDGPDNFEITTNFPKRVLYSRCNYEYNDTLTIEQAGLKNRETLYINDLDA
ncbi:UBX domain [Popillia japonica]|uniref:UBX domain n=1 Tax=Popillia japonica TaxID=7064 RepID=A0AAW1JXI2_POPJA